MTSTEPNQLDPTWLPWATCRLCAIVMVVVMIMLATATTPTYINIASTQRERVS